MSDDGRPIRVLLVDDEPDVADVTASFLERERDRITVVTVTDAREGLDRLETDAIDCVVSDYQMPEMDGLAFLRAIRERHPTLPFILYTGKGSEAVASEAISAGATDYLRKGADPSRYELLANRIEGAVERQRSERRAVDLERIRDLFDAVNQALVRADSRAAIESAVCDILAEIDRYDAAVVASPTEDGGLEPTSASGIDDPPPVDETTPKPAVVAIESEEVLLVENLLEQDDPVSEALSERGFRNVAVAPLIYDGTRHGVIAVLAGEAGTLGERDRDVLDELAGDVAHAIETVETRRELERERDRRAALFENAPASMVEFTYEDGRPVIREVNPAFEETFGYDAGTVVGEPVVDVLVDDDQRDSVDGIAAGVREGEHVRREVSLETADGTRQFLLTIAPFELGDVRGGYAWYVDVTERKELQAELRDKANLLDQLFEQLPVSLYVKDREGRHLYMSDYDVAPGEVIGKTDREIYGEELARRSYEDDMHVVETGESIINKEEYNPDNDEWTLTSKVPWYGEDGEIKGLIGVTRFITEKKAYEREIERKNERLEKFASVISHDLRNPLNVAAGHVDLLAQDYDDSRLDRIETALERMDALIDDILELARHGEAAFDPEEISLSDLTERAWENVQTGDVDLVIADDLQFCGAKARVLELLENLLTNACEHGDPSTITVGALDDAEGFYVADDGSGIPADERDEIFRPGYSTQDDGTGFGLSIVEEIVESQNWEIAVTDSDTGGARFEITGVEPCKG